MITATKFEALGESEEELEEGATELEPLFSRGKAIAQPFGEQEGEPEAESARSEDGALKYRGSNGTVTVIAPAGIGSARADLTSALKTNGPERFIKPWEFQISREEALYDLSCASTFWGALGDKLGRLVHRFAFRREFRKWQVLLNGRSVDEQLWSVRPPRGGLTHPFVQTWAKNAIELAEYDPRNMLTEWQIFWRRKGV